VWYRATIWSWQDTQSSNLQHQQFQLKRAVEEVSPTVNQFVSCIFLVPKTDGTYRPVLNLKPLNLFLEKLHFRMEGLSSVKELLQPSDWLSTVDQKDAYLLVAIVKEHKKFLRFVWQGRTFQFTCLPFGLCSALRMFTKFLRPIMPQMCNLSR